MISNHSHTTSNSNTTYTISGATIPGCNTCEEDKLIARLVKFIRNYNPYQPHQIDPKSLIDLLEGKDGPDDYYMASRNERIWSYDRFSGRILWGVNWAFGINIWGGRDYGMFDIDFGPFRFHSYARWGLTEDQRMNKWLKHDR